MTRASLRGRPYRGSFGVAPQSYGNVMVFRRRQETGRQESGNGQERPQRREPQGRVEGATGPRTAAAAPGGQRTEYVPVRDTGDDRVGRWAACHASLQLESPTCMVLECLQDGPGSISQVVKLGQAVKLAQTAVFAPCLAVWTAIVSQASPLGCSLQL